MELQRRLVRQPGQRRRVVGDHVPGRLPRICVGVRPAGDPVGSVVRDLLLPEPPGAGAVRVPVEVDRSVVQVGQEVRGDADQVADQVAFGHGWFVAVTREEHLVDVGELHRAALELPGAVRADGVQCGQLVGRRRVPGRLVAVAGPRGVGPGPDLVVGAAGLDRAGVVLGVPAGDGVVVVLVQQEPVPVASAAVDEDEATGQLLAAQVDVEIAGVDGGLRVVALGEGPGAPVPDDDVAAAVLTGRDHPLEVEVVQRVVLDVHGEAPSVRVDRRSLGHRPADEDTVDLEAQVVVEPAGPVTLDDEAVARVGWRVGAGGLGGDGEVALGPVVGEPFLRVAGRHVIRPSPTVD